MRLSLSLVTLVCLAAAPTARGLSTEGDRTITKVIKLLQGMLVKSKEDGDKDRELFAKYKCYCDMNIKKKTAAMTEAEKTIKLLSSKIAEHQAATGELSTENADLAAKMSENEEARKTATELRSKANADFKSQETDMTAASSQMDKAIDTLSAIGADQTAFLAENSFMHRGSQRRLKSDVEATLKTAALFLPKKQRESVSAFIQAPGDYSAQSGEIVGILKNMRDTFKSNLESAKASEKASKESDDKFQATKTSEFDTMKAATEANQKVMGDNDDALATAKKTKEEVEASFASDEVFTAKLTTLCATKTKEYEERKTVRANEEAAVAQATSILNSDTAFETFGATKSVSFLQMRMRTTRRTARELVATRLAKDAKAHKSLRLARVAALLEGGNPLDKVCMEVEKMMALIDKEAASDKEQLEWCNSERTENDKTKGEKQDEIDGLNGKVDELTEIISNEETGLKAKLAEEQAKLADNQKDQEDEIAGRGVENRAYQKNVSNLKSAQKILKKATKVLADFYKTLEDKPALLQRIMEDPAPPSAEFSDTGSDKGGDVIGMLENIIAETKTEEETAEKDEADSVKEFEDTMKTLKDQEAASQDSIAELSEQLAEKEKALIATNEDLAKTLGEHKAIEKYLLKIKPGCDFITENIDARDEHRAAERKSLNSAEDALKTTPAYKKAAAAAEKEALGECADKCPTGEPKNLACKACIAGTSESGYCGGHAADPVCK